MGQQGDGGQWAVGSRQ